MKESTTCPMCSARFSARNDLRVHIMCDHRKSAVVDDLLAVLEAHSERSQQAQTQRPLPVLNP